MKTQINMNSVEIIPLKQTFNQSLVLPGSKSISNRALILAALCKEKSVIDGLLESDDTLACREALKNLEKSPLHELVGTGLVPARNNRRAQDPPLHRFISTLQCPLQNGESAYTRTRERISEFFVNDDPSTEIPSFEKAGCRGDFSLPPSLIHCQDAGTVARFLLPICAALGGEYYFDASTRLRVRPIKPLIDLLKQQGVKFQFLAEPNHLPFIIQSTGLQGGKLFIDIHHSSQFLSGLCMAAPLAQEGMILQANKEIEHKPYVMMTLQLMEKFGISYSYHDDFTLEILPAEYKATPIAIEPDASTASYFFAAAALTQSTIHVKNLTNKSCQGDLKFVDVLEKMGCEINKRSSGISVTGPLQLKSIDSINMNSFSDTFMTLAILAPFLPTPTTICGIHHTRHQESDRINAIMDGLHRVGIRTMSTDDSLTIFPGKPTGNTLHSHHDHRIAMAFSILGLKIPGIIINDAQCVSKTCPLFFEYLAQLNGENNGK